MAQGMSWRATLAAPHAGQLRHPLHPDDEPGGPDEVAEEGGRPAGARTDVEHPLALVHVEQGEHRPHGRRLGAGLVVADPEGPVLARPVPLGGREEAPPVDRREGRVEGVGVHVAPHATPARRPQTLEPGTDVGALAPGFVPGSSRAPNRGRMWVPWPPESSLVRPAWRPTGGRRGGRS